MRMTVADDAELGKSAIRRGMRLFSVVGSPTNEVMTGVMSLQAGRVQRGQRNPSTAPHRGDDLRKKHACRCDLEASGLRLLKSRPVWNRFEADGPSQIRTVGEHRREASEVSLQELLEDKASQKLMRRELPGRVDVESFGQRPLRDLKRRQ